MATPDRFDCVEMKRKAQEKIQAEIRGMTIEQELAYWRKYEVDLLRRVEASKRSKVA